MNSLNLLQCSCYDLSIMNKQLSPDQRDCLEQLYSWYRTRPTPYITLGGYAGVGKSTLIAVYRKLLLKHNPKLKIAFCSFTGRAARVLHQKLKEAEVLISKDSVGTIHSLIYSPIIDDHKRIKAWKLKEDLPYDLIIVDEASMVSKMIWDDLTSYGIPIVAVGDHGQLPPIESGFNLMSTPHLRLEKIHRQAEDNPIIKVSLLARENGYIPARRFGTGVVKYDRAQSDSFEAVESLLSAYTSDLLVLCGYNKTRLQLNQAIRQNKGIETQQPTKGDRVICLKNNHQKSIFNGMLGTIESIHPADETWYKADIAMDDEVGLFSGNVLKNQFGEAVATFSSAPKLKERGDFFDFGYALTVHKSQGSQARRVLVFEERFPKMDESMWRKWLYTAVTRAEEELYIVGDTKENDR